MYRTLKKVILTAYTGCLKAVLNLSGFELPRGQDTCRDSDNGQFQAEGAVRVILGAFK